MFSVHPEADISVTSSAARSFNGVYGRLITLELHSVVAYFDGRASLGNIIDKMPESASKYILDITTWLLR